MVILVLSFCSSAVSNYIIKVKKAQHGINLLLIIW
jgi:hypothetical protein